MDFARGVDLAAKIVELIIAAVAEGMALGADNELSGSRNSSHLLS